MAESTFDFGVKHTWIEDETVLLIEAPGDIEREAVDAWADSTINVFKNWPREGIIFNIQKLDSGTQGLTPYARKRTQDVADALPEDRKAYIAVVLQDSFMSQIISFFVRSMRWNNAHQERIFTEYADALAWIKAKQTEENAKN